MKTVIRVALPGLLVLAVALFSACVGGGDDDAPSSDRASTRLESSGGFVTQGESQARDADDAATDGGGAAAVGAAPAEESSPGAGAPSAPGDDSANGQTPAQQAGPTRSIVFTAWMVVIVEDVPSATEQARTAIAGLGGLVFGQNTQTEPIARTVLTFKVPPESFDEALRRLAEVGELDNQQVSADDVTERVVDLESRIVTSEASVDRLRAFLETAINLEAVAQLERELLQRETDLELLRGQLRTLQGQVDLATITVTITEDDPPEPEAAVELLQTGYLGHDAGDGCPDDDELTVDEGKAFTVCVSIENTGNLALTEIEVRDGGLDLDDDEFMVLEGNLDGELAPGERIVGYFETEAELGSFPNPSFSATVLDEDGDELRIGISVEGETLDLEVIEDTSVPGFTEGLSGSFGALVTGAQFAVLVAGVLVPFLWLPVVAGLVMVWMRRREPSTTSTPPTAPPPADAGGDD